MTAGIIWIKSATRHRMAARWRRMRGDDPGVVLVPQIRSTPTVRAEAIDTMSDRGRIAARASRRNDATRPNAKTPNSRAAHQGSPRRIRSIMGSTAY
jgi:hypothetical protein